MNVLLSIKPKYAKKILMGEKKYEFRRFTFKNAEEIGYIYLYSTSPIKRIVGKFQIERVIEDSPTNLWNQFNGHSGVRKKEFFEYFEGKKKGFAIEIKDVIAFQDPINPKEIVDGFTPPRSFYYLKNGVPWSSFE